MDSFIPFEWQAFLNEDNIVLLLDFIGTFAFAISGIRLAMGSNIDLFGAYVIGMLTAVGGGTIRDLLLGVTPFWLTTPTYVIITLISLLIVVAFRKQLVKMNEQLFLDRCDRARLLYDRGNGEGTDAGLPLPGGALYGRVDRIFWRTPP